MMNGIGFWFGLVRLGISWRFWERKDSLVLLAPQLG